ncbi:hypothetical protein [Natranaeroarchaeum sulfidigenes]|uniref:hypothetical protein n=1 Tax=Natranaeroarchaeum sulfidigenes TaxID=2784880 RepID=UPI001EE585E9|nr:hypothetical protein [Natranaeroarchaeum sulfidigenes]
MDSILRLARGAGWAVAFIGACVILYPVFSFLARFGVRSLDETFGGTYLVTGSFLHLPVILVLGFVIVIAGFHLLGWIDNLEKRKFNSNEDAH